MDQTVEEPQNNHQGHTHARLHEETSSALAALCSAAGLLTRGGEVYPAVVQLSQEASRLFGAARAGVFRYGATEELTFVAGVGISPKLARKIEDIGQTEAVIRYLTLNDGPLVIKDGRWNRSSPEINRIASEEGIVTLAGIRLAQGGRLLGLFVLLHEARHDYSADELAAFQGFASLISLALTTAGQADVQQWESREKDHFLRALSHELRTPLTSIMGFTQMIRKRLAAGRDTDARLLEQVDVLWTQAQRLNRLIDTLVDIANIERGEFVIAQSRVEMDSLLKDTVAQVQAQSHPKHVITMDLPGAEVWVYGDGNRLEQLVSHLLTNALRYSPSDLPVTVKLQDRRGEGKVIISITDHGPGVPTNLRRNIFERFYPSEEPRSGGLGIGLYISKTIVEAHGGHISLDSEPKSGTTVTVTLPA